MDQEDFCKIVFKPRERGYWKVRECQIYEYMVKERPLKIFKLEAVIPTFSHNYTKFKIFLSFFLKKEEVIFHMIVVGPWHALPNKKRKRKKQKFVVSKQFWPVLK